MFVHKFLVLCGCLVTLLAVLLGRARVSERRFGSQYEENSILFSRSVYTETEKTEKFKNVFSHLGLPSPFCPSLKDVMARKNSQLSAYLLQAAFLQLCHRKGSFRKKASCMSHKIRAE